MGMHKRAGFTILETMLFLAITGVLIIALLTGVGVSINTQRYRDSVQSLKSLVQDQYSQLDNVSIPRDPTDASWSCNTNAQTSQGSPNSGLTPGQSNCFILGRYMVIDQDAITTQNVIGVQKGTETQGNDLTLLQSNYTLGLEKDSVETSSLEWGSKISWPVAGSGAQPAGTARSIGILLIRSPDSGTTYTFTVDSPASVDNMTGDDLMAMIVAGDNVSKPYNTSILRGQDQRTICIDSNGLVTAGMMAVVLQSYAVNTSSIQTQSNDLMQQLPNQEGTQC